MQERYRKFEVYSEVNFLFNNDIVGESIDYDYSRVENEAIKKYKNKVWNLQEFVKNYVSINDNFKIIVRVQLFGYHFNDSDFDILRKSEFESIV